MFALHANKIKIKKVPIDAIWTLKIQKITEKSAKKNALWFMGALQSIARNF